MTFSFLTSLPCKGDRSDRMDLSVREVTAGDPHRICAAWQNQVQPLIASDINRVDRTWNWRLLDLTLRLGGALRGARLFQLAVGRERRPAAMIALLTKERWIDWTPPSVFLWYLAAAPDACLQATSQAGRSDVAGLVGMAAIDTALVLSLRGTAKGRLWLHADPKGGNPLLVWYGINVGATRVPEEAFVTLPGISVRGPRSNDGRYFAFTHETALWAYKRLSAYRR